MWFVQSIETLATHRLTIAKMFAHATDRKDLGSVLTPHCDDRQLSSDILVNLSLVSDCTMTYIHEKHPERRVEVYLPRRSLQIQSGSTRYDYMHSIANENLHGDRRVSVTFRESGAFTAKKK